MFAIPLKCLFPPNSKSYFHFLSNFTNSLKKKILLTHFKAIKGVGKLFQLNLKKTYVRFSQILEIIENLLNTGSPLATGFDLGSCVTPYICRFLLCLCNTLTFDEKLKPQSKIKTFDKHLDRCDAHTCRNGKSRGALGKPSITYQLTVIDFRYM